MNTFSIQTFKRSVAQNKKRVLINGTLNTDSKLTCFLAAIASKKEWNVLPQNIKEDLSVDTLD